MIEEGLVTFFTTHDAMKAENLCKKGNVKASLIPLHPDIEAGCGFMLKINWKNFENLISLLNNQDLNYKGCYYSKKKGIKRELMLLYENI